MKNTLIRRIAAGAAALALAAPISACSDISSTAADSDSTVEQTADIYPLGQTVNVKNGDNEAQITVADLVKGEPDTTLSSDTAGQDFYSATVTIKVTKGTWHVNPLSFAFYTTDGTKGDEFADVQGVKRIDSGDQPAGALIKGGITTSVPAGQQIARITTEAGLSVVATWTVQ